MGCHRTKESLNLQNKKTQRDTNMTEQCHLPKVKGLVVLTLCNSEVALPPLPPWSKRPSLWFNGKAVCSKKIYTALRGDSVTHKRPAMK